MDRDGGGVRAVDDWRPTARLTEKLRTRFIHATARPIAVGQSPRTSTRRRASRATATATDGDRNRHRQTHTQDTGSAQASHRAPTDRPGPKITAAYLVKIKARAMVRSDGARQRRADEEEVAPSMVQIVREVFARHGTLWTTGTANAHETCRGVEDGAMAVAAVVNDRRIRR